MIALNGYTLEWSSMAKMHEWKKKEQHDKVIELEVQGVQVE